jgi:hypothetical protein
VLLLFQELEGFEHLNSAKPFNVWGLAFGAFVNFIFGLFCGLGLFVALE